MRRLLFLFYVYTGMRAVSNRLWEPFLPDVRLRELDGTMFSIEEFGKAKIRVNRRRLPKQALNGISAGMISVALVTPGISKLAYAALLLTSHFGLGHIEVAFYENKNEVVIYAVRNIIEANLKRFGLYRFFSTLKLSDRDDEARVLQQIVDELKIRDIQLTFASPEECVQFAVQPELIESQRRRQVTKSIRRNYKRLIKQIDL